MVQSKQDGKNRQKDVNRMAGTLISHHLPADYHDTYHQVVNSQKDISPEDLLAKIFGNSPSEMFDRSPSWLKGLFKMRELLVKPLGIETRKTANCRWVTEKTEQEAMLEKDDKHLKFYVSIQVVPQQENIKDVRITTVVKYHNALGRIYFFFIRPVHRFIVPISLKKILKSYAHE